jgi:plastocyanin domain-containing protein
MIGPTGVVLVSVNADPVPCVVKSSAPEFEVASAAELCKVTSVEEALLTK